MWDEPARLVTCHEHIFSAIQDEVYPGQPIISAGTFDRMDIPLPAYFPFCIDKCFFGHALSLPALSVAILAII